MSWEELAQEHWGMNAEGETKAETHDEVRDCGPCDSPEDYATVNVEMHSCGL